MDNRAWEGVVVVVVVIVVWWECGKGGASNQPETNGSSQKQLMRKRRDLRNRHANRMVDSRAVIGWKEPTAIPVVQSRTAMQDGWEVISWLIQP
jgi:hypothetical protein